MSKKDKLLHNLEDDTYVRLRPSKLQGVGIFAIKDIPKDVNPFRAVRILNGGFFYKKLITLRI
jgi:hypothetical protein